MGVRSPPAGVDVGSPQGWNLQARSIQPGQSSLPRVADICFRDLCKALGQRAAEAAYRPGVKPLRTQGRQEVSGRLRKSCRGSTNLQDFGLLQIYQRAGRGMQRLQDRPATNGPKPQRLGSCVGGSWRAARCTCTSSSPQAKGGQPAMLLSRRPCRLDLRAHRGNLMIQQPQAASWPSRSFCFPLMTGPCLAMGLVRAAPA